MHITCLFNPRSGRGKGLAGARSLESRLAERGHRVVVLEMTENPESLCSQIQSSDRVVVIGGDGTVHHLLPTLLKAQTPIYHFGTGTANLIAKEFGMSKSPKRIVEHLEQPIEPTRVDVPTCNGLAFLIMVSVGIDASVIHRFAAARATKKAGYRAYFQPIVHELFSPNPARFTITPGDQSGDQTSDFKPIHTTGIGVISNLRSYGGGFNPNPKANPCDGLLDAAAIQCKGSLGAGVQLGLLRMRYTSSKIKRASAMSMDITCDAPCPVQVDGERADRIPGITNGSLCPGQSLQIVVGNDFLLFHAPKAHSTSKVR